MQKLVDADRMKREIQARNSRQMIIDNEHDHVICQLLAVTKYINYPTSFHYWSG